MTIEKVKEIMETRNFTEMSRSMKGREVQSIYFISQEKTTASIGCNVTIETGEFEFSYVVPYSINVLTSKKCSPFDSDKHFEKIYSKFKAHALVLDEHFGRN